MNGINLHYSDKAEFANIKIFLLVISLLIIAFLASRVSNDLTYHRPNCDSGVFATTSMHLIYGKVLYKDVFDHKPPVIYLINAASFIWGDNKIYDVRKAERIFAISGSLLFFFIIHKVFNSVFLSLISTLLFLRHFYSYWIFAFGNLTEEYGAIFIIAGVFCAIFATHGRENFFQMPASFLSGLFFSLAMLSKEPFFLSSIPWCLYVVWHCIEKRTKAIRAFAVFFAGLAMPFLVFASYLIYNNAMSSWFDVLSFSFANSNVTSVPLSLFKKMYRNFSYFYKYQMHLTITAQIFFVVSWLSLLDLKYQKQYRFIVVVFLVQFVMDYLGTMLSHRGYGHYYMQISASFILVSAAGIAYLFWLLKNRLLLSVNRLKIIAGILLVTILLVDFHSSKKFFNRLTIPSQTPAIGAISEYINKNKKDSDRLWVPSVQFSAIYSETQLLSPTKYTYALPHLFIDTKLSTKDQKIELIKRQLQTNTPRFIVLYEADHKFLKKVDILPWILDNYNKSNIFEKFEWEDKEYRGYLYINKKMATDPGKFAKQGNWNTPFMHPGFFANQS